MTQEVTFQRLSSVEKGLSNLKKGMSSMHKKMSCISTRVKDFPNLVKRLEVCHVLFFFFFGS